jgi:hypothetical protein
MLTNDEIKEICVRHSL